MYGKETSEMKSKTYKRFKLKCRQGRKCQKIFYIRVCIDIIILLLWKKRRRSGARSSSFDVSWSLLSAPGTAVLVEAYLDDGSRKTSFFFGYDNRYATSNNSLTIIFYSWRWQASLKIIDFIITSFYGLIFFRAH